MKLIPLGDKVVMKQVEAEETTASGIILQAKTQEKRNAAFHTALLITTAGSWRPCCPGHGPWCGGTRTDPFGRKNLSKVLL